MRGLLLVVVIALAACHVTPLPVPNADEWQPGYDVTEYPPLNVGGAIPDASAREAAP